MPLSPADRRWLPRIAAGCAPWALPLATLRRLLAAGLVERPRPLALALTRAGAASL